LRDQMLSNQVFAADGKPKPVPQKKAQMSSGKQSNHTSFVYDSAILLLVNIKLPISLFQSAVRFGLFPMLYQVNQVGLFDARFLFGIHLPFRF